MANEASDPFTLVYDELWSMLEEDKRFDVLVGNRLKFNQNKREPVKTQMSSADYPEVALLSEGVTGNLCNTSSSSMLVRRFSWVISAGDLRNEKLFPLEWAIFAGMLAWRHRLTLLTWEGEPFVKNTNIVDSTIQQAENMRRRGITGFIAVWTVEVEMHFQTSLIDGGHLST